MPRASTIGQLSLSEIELVNKLIRASRYRSMNTTLEALRKEGIDVSRSALGRYALSLKRDDGLMASPADNTIITIVERNSGKIRVVKTSAPADAIASHLESLVPTTEG